MPVSSNQDVVAATAVLQKIERLSPGCTDYCAFASATRALTDSGDVDLADELSVKRCGAASDDTGAPVRLDGASPGHHARGAHGCRELGDNLMRTLIERGLAPQMDTSVDFLDRPRR